MDVTESGAATGTTGKDALEALLNGRLSCRGFLQQPVRRGDIKRMLELAQRSPSWCNSQPWQVHVTSGPATERFRESLCAYATSQGGGAPSNPDFPFPTAYTGVYRDRRRECGWQLYESVGVAKGDRAGSAKQAMENFRFFGAPHALVVTTERDLGVYGAVDCGCYIACLVLAAQSLGIATIPQAAIAGCAPVVRQFFQLPDNRLVLVGMSFGYADPAHPANQFRTRRAAVADVVHWQENKPQTGGALQGRIGASSPTISGPPC